MAEIRTKDDFLRALREHPEWKEAVRMEILGQELLSLPNLVKENSEQISRLNIVIEHLTDRVDRLAKIAVQHDHRLQQVENRLERVEDRLQRVEDRVGYLQGDFTEDKYRKSLASRASKIEGRIKITNILSPSEVDDLIYEASVAGIISENEADQLSRADSIALATVRSTGEEITLVTEISQRIHIDDVIRAQERAAIAARVISNRRAIPVVMGPEGEVIRDKSFPGVWLIENYSTRELIG